MGIRELDKQTYIDAIRENTPLFVAAAEEGLSEPVPSCPGWYMATLVAHLGEVQRFWAHQVISRAQERQQLPGTAYESCPGLLEWLDSVDAGTPDLHHIPNCLVDWYRAGAEELASAFETVEPDEAIWHWSGDNRAITHMRNQAIEATVHRWDAQNAHGNTTAINTEIARDGIEQHFQVQIAAARGYSEYQKGTGETYHFHSTDREGEWLVRFDGDDVIISHEHAKGDIALRGTDEDIFLWLWGRTPADRLEVFGDESLLDRYRMLVPSSS